MSLASLVYSTKFWEQDKNDHKEDTEQWKRAVLKDDLIVWVSDSGKCISEGKILSVSESQQRYSIKRTIYSPIKLVAIAFKVSGYERLRERNIVCTLINDRLPLKPENVKICDRTDVIIKNTKARESKGYLSPLIKNGKAGVVFEEGYCIYPDGTIYSLRKTSQEQPIKLGLGVVNGRILFRGGREDRRMYVDILMLITFGELKEKDYDEVLNNYDIIHKDGNFLNDQLENLTYKPKKLSIETQRKIRVEERKDDLYNNIINLLSSRQAVLLTPKEEITTGFSMFKYRCLCGEKETCYNYLVEGKECFTCRNNKLKEQTTGSAEVKYEDMTLNGIHFKRFDVGWVSSCGIVLNNLKKNVAIVKGYIKISNVKYNLKNIMAKVFNLPNVDKLDQKGYHVFQIVSNNDFSINNLVIRTQAEDNVIRKRNANHERDMLLLKEEQKKEEEIKESSGDESSDDDELSNRPKHPSMLDVKGVRSITHEDYPHLVFYENGIYRSSIGIYNYGALSKNGYYTVNIFSKSYKVHRLICFLFNPIEGKHKLSDYDGLEVNHKNSKKYDNHYTNLEWCTPKQNREAGVEMNLYKSNKPLAQYSITSENKRGDEIQRFKTIKDAIVTLHISRKKLSEIATTQNAYKGFIYAFV